MKSVIVLIISFYQTFISSTLRTFLGVQTACRFPVSCSEYAKRSIITYGVIKGSILATKRLLSCQPFGRIQS